MAQFFADPSVSPSSTDSPPPDNPGAPGSPNNADSSWQQFLASGGGAGGNNAPVPWTFYDSYLKRKGPRSPDRVDNVPEHDPNGVRSPDRIDNKATLSPQSPDSLRSPDRIDNGTPPAASPQPTSNTISVQDAKMLYWTDDTVREHVQAMMVQAGKQVSSSDGAWADIVDASSKAMRLGRFIDPFDMLALKLGLTGPDAVNSGPRSGASKTTTDTTTQTDISSLLSRNDSVRSAIRGLLGRAATDGELSQFSSAIAAGESSAPRTQTVTHTADSQGNNTTNAVTVGSAFDPTGAMQQAVMNSPEYKTYKTNGDAMTALFRAIQSPTGV